MKKITYGVIGVMLLTWSSATLAEMPARAKETLRGLPGVTVVVEPLQASAEQDGLTRRLLQAVLLRAFLGAWAAPRHGITASPGVRMDLETHTSQPQKDD